MPDDDEIGKRWARLARRPLKIGTVTTVDMETGEVVGVRPNAMTILPAPPGTCPECAVDHPHDQPHDRRSLTYQHRFYATHGRWPDWADAMAHCSPEVRDIWRHLMIDWLEGRGLEVPEDLKGSLPPGR